MHPRGMQHIADDFSDFFTEFQFMHPVWDATDGLTSDGTVDIFQFMHPVWDATAKYSIRISIYTIFCICYILLHLYHNDIDVNFMFQFVIIGASQWYT